MPNIFQACYQFSALPKKCCVCSQKACPVHMPTGVVGYFCQDCCPACKPTETGGEMEQDSVKTQGPR